MKGSIQSLAGGRRVQERAHARTAATLMRYRPSASTGTTIVDAELHTESTGTGVAVAGASAGVRVTVQQKLHAYNSPVQLAVAFMTDPRVYANTAGMDTMVLGGVVSTVQENTRGLRSKEVGDDAVT